MARKRRWNRIQEQILVWPGDERLEIRYDGTLICVPPRTEVARVGPGHPYRYPAAQTKAGVPLKGTIAVTDQIVDTDDGGYRKQFDVSDFCEFLEEHAKHLFDAGFQIVSDPDDVTLVIEEGIPLYDRSLDKKAREILANELQRRKGWEDRGQPAPPSSSEHLVIWALQHQKRRAAQKPQVDSSQIYAALEGTTLPALAAAAPPVSDVKAMGAQHYLEEATKLGIRLNKAELTALIEGDAEQIEFIQAKIEERKTQRSPSPEAADEEAQTTATP